MKDKFELLERRFNDRRQLYERFISGVEKIESHPYWVETSNKLIMDEVLRLADEFRQAEQTEATDEKST